MKPLINIGPFTLHFFGLMIAIGAIIGLTIFIKEAKRRGYDHQLLLDIAIYSLIGGVIGARIVYVFVYNPLYYINNPIEILFIHEGGLSIHGGLIGGLFVGFVLLRRHKLPVWKILDLVAPSLILAQGISRIGCDVFGGPISQSLPWGIEFSGEYLHPAQAYEFILNYLLFGYLWIRLKKTSYNGQVFSHYLVGFMINRGLVEFTRENPTVFGIISVSHLLSIIGIIVGTLLIVYLSKQNTRLDNIAKPTKKDYIKVTLFVLLLTILSLGIYYWVQG